MRPFFLITFFLACNLLLSATPGKREIKLSIRNTDNQFTDVTTIFLDQGTSPTYLFQEDAKKVFNPNMLVPQIYCLTSDSVECQTSGFGPFTSTMIIPIGFKLDTIGQFTIFLSLIDNFDPTTILRLEDRTTGVFYNLRSQDFSFTLETPQKNNNRFRLHISQPAVIQTSDALCNDNDGSITITQDTSIVWTACQLFDSSGTLLYTTPNATGTFTYTNLAEGNYNLAFILGNYVVTKPIHVDGYAINVSIGSSTQNAAVGQEVQFFSMTTNTTGFAWTFGDSSIITGIANPQFAYYTPGTYTVILRASNAQGCVAFDTLIITVSTATSIDEAENASGKLIVQNKTIRVENFPYPSVFELFNLNGQLIYSDSVEAIQQGLPFTGLQNGLYVARLSGQSFVHTQKILLY